jgi:tagatose 1,6-diphosphate aldolase
VLLRRAAPPAFAFVDPGPLVDRELQLVAPESQWVEPMLAAMEHPDSRRADPGAVVTRPQLQNFLRIAPHGHQPPDMLHDRLPTYHFWMHLRPEYDPPLVIAGAIGLRVGHNEDTDHYYGHVGYNVFAPARGNHYAERATRLLFPLARRHGLRELWITCNPDNHASRRTCERIGAIYIEIVDVPKNHPLWSRGERQKCRYRIDL